MLRLAGPVVLAEIGWMSMGIVDTLIRISAGIEDTADLLDDLQAALGPDLAAGADKSEATQAG